MVTYVQLSIAGVNEDEWTLPFKYIKSDSQIAKNVLPNSPWLVGFPVGLVLSVRLLRFQILGEIQFTGVL